MWQSTFLANIFAARTVKKFLIYATEAYCHEEKDETGKTICYGTNKTKDEARRERLVTAALFDQPGTWCIYDGQLLLSVTSDQFPDNVLIKNVKAENGETLGPDEMAHALCLYKSKPGYCNCHGRHSLDAGSNLYLIDGEEPLKIAASPRINIKSKKELLFAIADE